MIFCEQTFTLGKPDQNGVKSWSFHAVLSRFFNLPSVRRASITERLYISVLIQHGSLEINIIFARTSYIRSALRERQTGFSGKF